MVAGRSTSWRSLRGWPLPSLIEGNGNVWRWVALSGSIHAILICSLFIIPYMPSRKIVSYPVYTVDLVGGEKLGGTSLGSVVTPAPQAKKENKKAQSEPPPRVETAKKEKSQSIERPALMREEAVLGKSQKEAKKEPPAQEGLSGQVREKLIQSALERVRERAEGGKGREQGERISAGPSEGEGAAAAGSGGRGGGIVKGIDFLVYRNQMLRLIRDRWAWVGKRSDLEVTVRFAIQENGEIASLKIAQSSGDLSYDDSVFRAIRRASPLPPPPESYRKDFMDVELTFRPKDLGG